MTLQIFVAKKSIPNSNLMKYVGLLFSLPLPVEIAIHEDILHNCDDSCSSFPLGATTP